MEHFYCGYEFNPRFMGVDLKMFLYLVGAVMLELIVMSIVFKHTQQTADGTASRAMRCYFFAFRGLCLSTCISKKYTRILMTCSENAWDIN